MTLVVCSVLDKQVSAYTPPFTARTTGEAIRMFDRLCRDTNLPFNSSPQDYALYELASLDDGTGVFKNAESPHKLAEATEFAKFV